MRLLTICSCLLTVMCLCGCEEPKKPLDAQQCLQRLESYGPARLDVVKLSELTADADTPKLRLFVKAMDACGASIKAPCVFRVELYEHVARSPSPVGNRLEIWPDIDLTDPDKNSDQWRDHLRAYEFNFDVNAKLTPGSVYIVEITCFSLTEKRLSVQYNLSY